MMHFWSRSLQRLGSEGRCNTLAAVVAVAAVMVLNLEAAPVPAGSATVSIIKPQRPIQIVVRKPSLDALPADLQNTPPVHTNTVATAPGASLPAVSEATDVAQTPAAAPSATTPVETPQAELTPVQLAEQAVQENVRLLEQGLEFLKKVPDYTAQFTKQELVDGELLEEQTMYLKVRHAPFSVYLKWLSGDVGREVLYVDGENDGQMLVHLGGWKARLPAVWLPPEGETAMAECRHPVTDAGLQELAQLLLRHHTLNLAAHNIVRCDVLADQEFGGRVCTGYLIEYSDRVASPEYRKSLTLIDKEFHVPVLVTNYGWPAEDCTETDPAALDEQTLVENYSYTELRFRQSLIASDFERQNSDYAFR